MAPLSPESPKKSYKKAKMKINWENIDSQNRKIIQKVTNDFFENLKISPELEVSFHFLSPSAIKSLNQKYREKNESTDVLSFPLWPNLKSIPQKGVVHLGDIFICPEILEQNAQKYQTLVDQELKKIIHHSLNHLIGKHH